MSEATSPPDATEPGPRAWRAHVVAFLAGQSISLFGSMLVQYALTWYLTLTTKSGTVLTLAMIFGNLPQAMISPFAGVWADRHNRKLLIMGADLAIAATTLALAVMMAAGHGGLWWILGAMAIRSLGAGVQTPAVGALLPQLVPAPHLMRVNSINASLQSGLGLAAPALAAWLYATFGVQSSLFVDVITAVIGVGFLLTVPVATIARHEATASYLADMREGLRYLRGHRVIRRVLVFFAVVFVLVVPPSWLTPLMVARTFGTEVWKLTVTEIGFSVGMILGSAILAWWGGMRDRMRMMLLAAVAFGFASIGLGLSETLAVFVFLTFAVGVAVPFFSTTATTLVQEQVEAEYVGRVFGLVSIVMAVAMPLGCRSSARWPIASPWSRCWWHRGSSPSG
jgi:DHA3 family macrolide efflux protein-like MFS transporter